MATTIPAPGNLVHRALQQPLLRAIALVNALFLAQIPYIFLRAEADRLRAPIDGAALERTIFGQTSVGWPQSQLYSGSYGWLEHLAVYVHASWFIIPPAVTILVALKYRDQFASYALWHLLVMYLAVAAFALVPMQPPWMADAHVTRVLAYHWGGAVHLDDNPLAAMPSLHVALPLTIALWAWIHSHRRLGAVMGAYSLLIGFCVVFLGEHYVMDVAGAAVLASFVALVGLAVEHRASERRPARAHGHAPATSARSLRSEHAQGLIEFALLMPFLLVFIFIIIDFGMGLNNRVIVTNAAREAARTGATGQSVSAIQQRAIEQSQGLVKNASDVQVTFYDTDSNPGLNPGDAVAVKIIYSYQWLSPLPIFSRYTAPLEMNACTDMRMEQVPVGATAAGGGSSPCS